MTVYRGMTWRWNVNFTSRPLYPQERTPVPIEQKAGLAPDPVWTVLVKTKSLVCTRTRIADRPARSQSLRGLITTRIWLDRRKTNAEADLHIADRWNTINKQIHYRNLYYIYYCTPPRQSKREHCVFCCGKILLHGLRPLYRKAGWHRFWLTSSPPTTYLSRYKLQATLQ